MRISGVTRTLVALAATATLTMTSPANAGQRGVAADPLVGAPTVGTCSTMTAAQTSAKTDASTVVPCTDPHTARVAGVVQLPASMDWGSASAMDLYKVIAKRCTPKVWTLMGRTPALRDMTAYSSYWFEPTKALKSQGARWLSCSIALAHGNTLADLPTDRTPMLPSGRLHDGIARCLTKSFHLTTCTAKHAWRASGFFTLHVANRPARKSLDKTAVRRCVAP